MADDEVQSWFRNLPYKLQRELAGKIKEIADELADAIRDAAPEDSGLLKQSIQVRRGRGTLELYVEAGGSLTTKEVRDGSGVPYDYALAQEFGTSHQPADPFFYPTYNELKDDVQEQLKDAVADVLDKA
jgi:HK97 gp10 family phage protein